MTDEQRRQTTNFPPRGANRPLVDSFPAKAVPKGVFGQGTSEAQSTALGYAASDYTTYSSTQSTPPDGRLFSGSTVSAFRGLQNYNQKMNKLDEKNGSSAAHLASVSTACPATTGGEPSTDKSDEQISGAAGRTSGLQRRSAAPHQQGTSAGSASGASAGAGAGAAGAPQPPQSGGFRMSMDSTASNSSGTMGNIRRARSDPVGTVDGVAAASDREVRNAQDALNSVISGLQSVVAAASWALNSCERAAERLEHSHHSSHRRAPEMTGAAAAAGVPGGAASVAGEREPSTVDFRANNVYGKDSAVLNNNAAPATLPAATMALAPIMRAHPHQLHTNKANAEAAAAPAGEREVEGLADAVYQARYADEGDGEATGAVLPPAPFSPRGQDVADTQAGSGLDDAAPRIVPQRSSSQELQETLDTINTGNKALAEGIKDLLELLPMAVATGEKPKAADQLLLGKEIEFDTQTREVDEEDDNDNRIPASYQQHQSDLGEAGRVNKSTLSANRRMGPPVALPAKPKAVQEGELARQPPVDTGYDADAAAAAAPDAAVKVGREKTSSPNNLLLAAAALSHPLHQDEPQIEEPVVGAAQLSDKNRQERTILASTTTSAKIGHQDEDFRSEDEDDPTDGRGTPGPASPENVAADNFRSGRENGSEGAPSQGFSAFSGQTSESMSEQPGRASGRSFTSVSGASSGPGNGGPGTGGTSKSREGEIQIGQEKSTTSTLKQVSAGSVEESAPSAPDCEGEDRVAQRFAGFRTKNASTASSSSVVSATPGPSGGQYYREFQIHAGKNNKTPWLPSGNSMHSDRTSSTFAPSTATPDQSTCSRNVSGSISGSLGGPVGESGNSSTGTAATADAAALLAAGCAWVGSSAPARTASVPLPTSGSTTSGLGMKLQTAAAQNVNTSEEVKQEQDGFCSEERAASKKNTTAVELQTTYRQSSDVSDPAATVNVVDGLSSSISAGVAFHEAASSPLDARTSSNASDQTKSALLPPGAVTSSGREDAATAFRPPARAPLPAPPPANQQATIAAGAPEPAQPLGSSLRAPAQAVVGGSGGLLHSSQPPSREQSGLSAGTGHRLGNNIARGPSFRQMTATLQRGYNQRSGSKTSREWDDDEASVFSFATSMSHNVPGAPLNRPVNRLLTDESQRGGSVLEVPNDTPEILLQKSRNRSSVSVAQYSSFRDVSGESVQSSISALDPQRQTSGSQRQTSDSYEPSQFQLNPETGEVTVRPPQVHHQPPTATHFNRTLPNTPSHFNKAIPPLLPTPKSSTGEQLSSTTNKRVAAAGAPLPQQNSGASDASADSGTSSATSSAVAVAAISRGAGARATGPGPQLLNQTGGGGTQFYSLALAQDILAGTSPTHSNGDLVERDQLLFATSGASSRQSGAPPAPTEVLAGGKSNSGTGAKVPPTAADVANSMNTSSHPHFLAPWQASEYKSGLSMQKAKALVGAAGAADPTRTDFSFTSSSPKSKMQLGSDAIAKFGVLPGLPPGAAIRMRAHKMKICESLTDRRALMRALHASSYDEEDCDIGTILELMMEVVNMDDEKYVPRLLDLNPPTSQLTPEQQAMGRPTKRSGTTTGAPGREAGSGTSSSKNDHDEDEEVEVEVVDQSKPQVLLTEGLFLANDEEEDVGVHGTARKKSSRKTSRKMKLRADQRRARGDASLGPAAALTDARRMEDALEQRRNSSRGSAPGSARTRGARRGSAEADALHRIPMRSEGGDLHVDKTTVPAYLEEEDANFVPTQKYAATEWLVPGREWVGKICIPGDSRGNAGVFYQLQCYEAPWSKPPSPVLRDLYHESGTNGRNSILVYAVHSDDTDAQFVRLEIGKRWKSKQPVVPGPGESGVDDASVSDCASSAWDSVTGGVLSRQNSGSSSDNNNSAGNNMLGATSTNNDGQRGTGTSKDKPENKKNEEGQRSRTFTSSGSECENVQWSVRESQPAASTSVAETSRRQENDTSRPSMPLIIHVSDRGRASSGSSENSNNSGSETSGSRNSGGRHSNEGSHPSSDKSVLVSSERSESVESRTKELEEQAGMTSPGVKQGEKYTYIEYCEVKWHDFETSIAGVLNLSTGQLEGRVMQLVDSGEDGFYYPTTRETPNVFFLEPTDNTSADLLAGNGGINMSGSMEMLLNTLAADQRELLVADDVEGPNENEDRKEADMILSDDDEETKKEKRRLRRQRREQREERRLEKKQKLLLLVQRECRFARDRILYKRRLMCEIVDRYAGYQHENGEEPALPAVIPRELWRQLYEVSFIFPKMLQQDFRDLSYCLEKKEFANREEKRLYLRLINGAKGLSRTRVQCHSRWYDCRQRVQLMMFRAIPGHLMQTEAARMQTEDTRVRKLFEQLDYHLRELPNRVTIAELEQMRVLREEDEEELEADDGADVGNFKKDLLQLGRTSTLTSTAAPSRSGDGRGSTTSAVNVGSGNRLPDNNSTTSCSDLTCPPVIGSTSAVQPTLNATSTTTSKIAPGVLSALGDCRTIRNCAYSTTCLICMGDLDNDLVRFPCKHFFHYECAKDWLKRKGQCPACRRGVCKMVD